MLKMAASTSGSQGSLVRSPQHQPPVKSYNFDHLDKGDISLLSSTLKHNPKMELSKTDLLKLLSCLEGELQARDVAIATLKAEKVKSLLVHAKYVPLVLGDPYTSLERDGLSGVEGKVEEVVLRTVAKGQRAALENLIQQQKRAQERMICILRDMEERHKKVVDELDDEKQKHEHDTAQGDDITYGLEKERTRLRQELELEKVSHKKSEKDLKKSVDTLEEERSRQKQIVLLLLAERKKIIAKYIEERKRSEDLAQILSEEKVRIDSMAEGLEEESKKSLQMEAELEKHLAHFDTERQQLKTQFNKEEGRCKELESEVEKLRSEVDALKKQLSEAHSVAMFQANTALNMAMAPRPMTAPQSSSKTSTLPPQTPPRIGQQMTGPPPLMSNVTKVVQPTATISSVPVTGPTTGIARSVSPGHCIRNVMYQTSDVRPTGTMRPNPNIDHSTWTQNIQEVTTNVPATSHGTWSTSQVVQVSPRVSISNTPGTKVYTMGQGSKMPFHMNSTSAPTSKKPLPLGRGVPPPVPPNKPVVPPKKDVVRTAEGTEVLKKLKEGEKVGGVNGSLDLVLDQELQNFQEVLVSMAGNTP